MRSSSIRADVSDNPTENFLQIYGFFFSLRSEMEISIQLDLCCQSFPSTFRISKRP